MVAAVENSAENCRCFVIIGRNTTFARLESFINFTHVFSFYLFISKFMF
jgi:hypothetical protein